MNHNAHKTLYKYCSTVNITDIIDSDAHVACYVDGHDATLSLNPRWSGVQSFSYNTVKYTYIFSICCFSVIASSPSYVSGSSFFWFFFCLYSSRLRFTLCSAIPSVSSYDLFFFHFPLTFSYTSSPFCASLCLVICTPLYFYLCFVFCFISAAWSVPGSVP